MSLIAFTGFASVSAIPACEDGFHYDARVKNCVPDNDKGGVKENISPGECPTNWEKLSGNDKVCCPPGSGGKAKDCLFAKYINPTVTVLTGLAALAAIIGVIIGGLQYSASGGDPQKTAAGKAKVVKAIYGLVAFLFLYSALQFLSPGGISANTTAVKGGSGAAEQCSKTFLGLKPWFYYLPDASFRAQNGSLSCNIENFSLFGDKSKDKKSDLFPVLLAVADDLVRVAGLVAVVFVITGGVKFVTSSGEPDKTKQALETIINALVGLVIAIAAAAIISFIGSRLS